MPVCGSCASEVEARFRYCPWCAAPVRRKLVEFFPARPFAGESGKALRVSRYFPDSGEPGHVRFSVWNETGVAEAVVSLDEADAARLADFVRESAPARSEPTGLRALLYRLAGLSGPEHPRPPGTRSDPPEERLKDRV
jgi:hypothetical protein